MVAPLQSSSIPAPAYGFYLRDKTTLARLARIQWVSSATWTRRLYGPGGGSLRVNDQQIDSDLLVNSAYEPQEHLLEIVRDGSTEFLGVIDEVVYDSETGDWTCQFLDALDWWLSARQIWPSGDSDDQSSQPAETAIIHYVNGHLVAPSDGDRDVDNDLSGITFSLTADGAVGDNVSAQAAYEDLAALCRRLAEEGNVILNLSIGESGYTFDIREPVDKTAGETDAVIFSTGLRTAMRVTPTASRRGAINALRALAEESGGSRATTDYEDTADLAVRPRREGTLGNFEVDPAAHLAALSGTTFSVQVEPDPGNAPYREAWDLGDEVTVVLPPVDYALDQQIVEVTVALDAAQVETVQVVIGALPDILTDDVARIERDVQRVSRR